MYLYLQGRGKKQYVLRTHTYELFNPLEPFCINNTIPCNYNLLLFYILTYTSY